MKITQKQFYLEFDPEYRGDCPLEESDQESCFHWITSWHPELLVFHPKNESSAGRTASDKAKRAANEARAKRQGRLSGISDFVLLEARGGFHSALIELKREDRTKNRPTKEQLEIMEKASARGSFCAVVYGYDAFIACVKHYLSL